MLSTEDTVIKHNQHPITERIHRVSLTPVHPTPPHCNNNSNNNKFRLSIYLIAIKDECWASLNDKEKSANVVNMSPDVVDYTTAFLHLTTTIIADVEFCGDPALN